jgi:hypothetical protein
MPTNFLQSSNTLQTSYSLIWSSYKLLTVLCGLLTNFLQSYVVFLQTSYSLMCSSYKFLTVLCGLLTVFTQTSYDLYTNLRSFCKLLTNSIWTSCDHSLGGVAILEQDQNVSEHTFALKIHPMSF